MVEFRKCFSNFKCIVEAINIRTHSRKTNKLQNSYTIGRERGTPSRNGKPQQMLGATINNKPKTIETSSHFYSRSYIIDERQ